MMIINNKIKPLSPDIFFEVKSYIIAGYDFNVSVMLGDSIIYIYIYNILTDKNFVLMSINIQT